MKRLLIGAFLIMSSLSFSENLVVMAAKNDKTYKDTKKSLEYDSWKVKYETKTEDFYYVELTKNEDLKEKLKAARMALTAIKTISGKTSGGNANRMNELAVLGLKESR